MIGYGGSAELVHVGLVDDDWLQPSSALHCLLEVHAMGSDLVGYRHKTFCAPLGR